MLTDKRTLLVLGRMRGILGYLHENEHADFSDALFYLNHTVREVQQRELPREIREMLRKIPAQRLEVLFSQLKKILAEAESDFPARIIWKFRSETYPYDPLWTLLEKHGLGESIDRRAETLMRDPAMMHRNNLTAVLEHLEIRGKFEIVW